MQKFIKEEWIASWNAFNGLVQLGSSLEIFSCCTIMHPFKKLQVFAKFDPQKCYNTLSNPVLSGLNSARLFSFPQVENKVNSTPFWGCCWNPSSRNGWIKEGLKEEFSADFRKLYDGAKACIYANATYFE